MTRLALSLEEVERIDHLFGLVIENPGCFAEFHVDFAMRNCGRLSQFETKTSFSAKQRAVIDSIEVCALEEGLL